MGMEVMSKNRTMRRRSLYLTSPALAGAIWFVVTALTSAVTGGSGGAVVSGRGARAAGGAAVMGSDFSSWYSQTLISWGLPSSEMAKSAAFMPGTGLPFLSLANTSTTTNCTVSVKL